MTPLGRERNLLEGKTVRVVNARSGPKRSF
jgi:hypothetical protein